MAYGGLPFRARVVLYQMFSLINVYEMINTRNSFIAYITIYKHGWWVLLQPMTVCWILLGCALLCWELSHLIALGNMNI